MTMHAFLAAFGSPKLWYLPAAYAAVFLVQGGYVGWVAVKFFRSAR